MNRADRWETCLHESAHLIVGRALNLFQTSCFASVLANGGGLARLPAGLSGFRTAAATAAGIYGERLAKLFPVPEGESNSGPGNVSPVTEDAQRIASWAVERYAVACKTLPDEKLIAGYCTEGFEGQPREWFLRWRRVNAEARLLTWVHRHAIIKTATELFHNGIVQIPGDDEQDALFNLPGATVEA